MLPGLPGSVQVQVEEVVLGARSSSADFSYVSSAEPRGGRPSAKKKNTGRESDKEIKNTHAVCLRVADHKRVGFLGS